MTHAAGRTRPRMAESVRKRIGELLDYGAPVAEIAERTGISRRTISQMKGNGTGTISATRQICYAEGCTNPQTAGKFCARHAPAEIPASLLARLMAGKA